MKSISSSTWGSIARDNRTAAKDLMRGRQYRSCISRSYYSLYSELTDRLVAQRVQVHALRENPAHSDLPRLVDNNLKGLNTEDRRRVKKAIELLYKLRVSADYYPGQTIDAGAAVRALGGLHAAMKILEDGDA